MPAADAHRVFAGEIWLAHTMLERCREGALAQPCWVRLLQKCESDVTERRKARPSRQLSCNTHRLVTPASSAPPSFAANRARKDCREAACNEVIGAGRIAASSSPAPPHR